MEKAVIIGATSGLGWEVANRFLSQGWKLGVAGRNSAKLQELQDKYGAEQVVTATLDITEESSLEAVADLVDRLGGMDRFLHFAGVGWQNRELDPQIEMEVAKINVMGFYRMIDFAFNWFKLAAARGEFDSRHKAHIVAVSSMAATRGIAIAPSYSSTKKLQATYIEALSQLAYMQQLPIDLTDIRPGFVATPILGYKYPCIMSVEKAGKHILHAIEKRKHVYSFDWRYRVVGFFWRLLPRRLWERMTFVYGGGSSESNGKKPSK